jgi:osmoprotectant transport system substrate-binding protein
MTRSAAALLLLAAVGGCGTGERVVVGSKNFTEQRVLGELLSQVIEAAGLPVERKLDLGGTFVCDAALRAGQIDVYVEYTGTALTAVLKEPPDTDPARVLARVREAYAAAGLVWTEPLGFDNTFVLVVRPDAGVRTISAAVGPARGWTAAFGYEFQQRPDGYPALQRTYGLAFRDVRTMDLGLLYRALADRQADVAAGSATDGPIDTLGLLVLADDEHAFPPYEAVPVVRQATLERFPTLRGVLASLAGKLSVETMRRLNRAVDGEHRAPAEVVRELLAKGL